ncbi:uncharacterized mitochondrial protein AtMg00810-like [Pyrus x bretschneideri]|uniref:uncharacterized mitochondrial protein AtMg00810-like n=1 Tax=Pyrus x bretschneideri TaxID=225117 RepID=UPI0020302DDD|nr:uncharacterized mitochondrial protein AtMg00810-like [Pyrus x bretschneideri]
MGRLTYFLGLHIQYKSNGSLFINQSKYAEKLINKVGMSLCKPALTPSKPHTQLLTSEGTVMEDPTLYRSIVGALQHLTFTRPDIAHAVNVVCQYMTKLTDAHFFLVNRILRYVQGTIDCALTYTPSPNINILAFSYASWAADINTTRSISGYVVYVGNNHVSWKSKKQASVSRSSTEAKYKALAHCTANVCWIRNHPLALLCDNLSTLALSSNSVFHSRIKHLDTDYHFVRERVQNRDITVHYVLTDSQVVDILTKGLHSPLFIKQGYNLRLENPSGY